VWFCHRAETKRPPAFEVQAEFFRIRWFVSIVDEAQEIDATLTEYGTGRRRGAS
jgi:hypothetical protein